MLPLHTYLPCNRAVRHLFGLGLKGRRRRRFSCLVTSSVSIIKARIRCMAPRKSGGGKETEVADQNDTVSHFLLAKFPCDMRWKLTKRFIRHHCRIMLNSVKVTNEYKCGRWRATAELSDAAPTVVQFRLALSGHAGHVTPPPPPLLSGLRSRVYLFTCLCMY